MKHSPDEISIIISTASDILLTVIPGFFSSLKCDSFYWIQI